MARARWIRALSVVFGTMWLGGCYTYSTVGIGDVSVGNEVRAHVSDAEADRAEAALGYHSTTFEGEVLERDTSGALLMRVPGSVFSSSGQTERYFQRLRLMPADVVGLQARRLSLTRTGTLVGAGVVAAVIILKSVFTGSGGSLPPSGGGTGTLHNVVTPQG